MLIDDTPNYENANGGSIVNLITELTHQQPLLTRDYSQAARNELYLNKNEDDN